MSVTDAIILVLLNHEVIVNVTFDGLLEGTENRATVILAALGADQTLRIDIKSGASVDIRALNYLNSNALSLSNLFLRDDHGSQ